DSPSRMATARIRSSFCSAWLLFWARHSWNAPMAALAASTNAMKAESFRSPETPLTTAARASTYMSGLLNCRMTISQREGGGFRGSTLGPDSVSLTAASPPARPPSLARKACNTSDRSLACHDASGSETRAAVPYRFGILFLLRIRYLHSMRRSIFFMRRGTHTAPRGDNGLF